MFAFSALWPIIWHSLAGVGIIGICVAVVIFAVPQLRLPAIVVATSVAIALAVYLIGVFNGEQHKAAEWKQAEQHTITKAKRARSDAVRSVDHPRRHLIRLRKPARSPDERNEP